MAGSETEAGYPVFVYGTLRPDQPLWPWLKDSVVQGPYMAWVHGYRLAHSLYGGYPVMVPIVSGGFQPEKKLVRGTLVWVKNDPNFQSIWNMEVKAGYSSEKVLVSSGTNWDAITYTTEAFAFVWPLGSFQYGDYLEPEYLADGKVLYDWVKDVERNVIPGREEIQSIPSQKTTE